MECHGDEVNPVTGLLVRTCECDGCLDERRCRDIVASCERSLSNVICRLLDAGMMPAEIAASVKHRTRKKSRASMLTRIELTCQAGWWLSCPDRTEQLAQVDELAKYTGSHVGTTIPGWMQRWYMDKGNYDLKVITDAVLDVWVAMAPDLEDAWFAQNERAVLGEAFGDSPSWPDNVIPFPIGPW